jgi:hypothetical protein
LSASFGAPGARAWLLKALEVCALALQAAKFSSNWWCCDAAHAARMRSSGRAANSARLSNTRKRIYKMPELQPRVMST